MQSQKGKERKMADINDYLDGLNYSLTNDEKQLMDMFAECWEYCREHD